MNVIGLPVARAAQLANRLNNALDLILLPLGDLRRACARRGFG
jgi:hypothetical protein